ncbi:unnamed protein product [Penicillium nalgiovense]|nr:unnamed protein product [Penicillium nalgiovense]
MIRLIFTATTIITSSSAIYFYIFHERLSKRVAHKSHLGTLSTATKSTNIESIPESVFSAEYFTLYDHVSKSVSRACLPSNEATEMLFKRLVRRNMTAFSRFPQALVLAMASKTPEQKESFKAGYLAALDFEVGNLVCGVYQVVVRRWDRVEFEIKMETVDFVQARLAISFEESSQEGNVVFCSETVMWKRADEGRKMPLERPVLRWMHETAAWWLMDSGVRYLVDLEDQIRRALLSYHLLYSLHSKHLYSIHLLLKMCKHTYHHYPSCGHISNWSMTSCQEYTNKLRLAGPKHSVSCTQIKASHDLLLSTQPSMCVQCEREWAENLSHGDGQTQTSNPYRRIEGLDATGGIIEVDARMVGDPTPDDRDTSSTDHSDNGQIFLGAAVGNSGNGDKDGAGHSDNGQICPRAVVESESDCGRLARTENSSRTVVNSARANPSSEVAGDLDSFASTIKTSPVHPAHGCETDDPKGGVEVESPDVETAACASLSDASSDTGISDSLCGSSLIRYNVLKMRIDEYLEKRQQQREVDTDHNQHHADADVDDHHTLEGTVADHNSSNEPSLDIDIVQQRIEATVLKRIEENNEKEARQEAISKLLDTALLQKDRDDRREQNAELGIEEDPHLWDTESINRMWQAKNSTPATPANASNPVSPRTCPSRESQQSSPTPEPKPKKHMYMGSMFADEEGAYRRGLRDVRPYGNYSGEWEGFMMAELEDDANRQGLLDPVHVRGCCAERTADFHLFYGLMHAPSEFDAEKRWLEDIRRMPGEEGKFYGLLRADDLHHARAMGLTDIRHPWGCCKDALFTMPERVRHRYSGYMSAISLEEVGYMGLCDAEPVPGECGDYYGGRYYGYVEAYCELDAFQMGLKEPKHDGDCCAKAEVSVSISDTISDAGQYTYYGYMYASSEEEVVNRGLKDVLLVPGFDIKYSGNLQAGSEEEAKAMGLFEPSRI